MTDPWKQPVTGRWHMLRHDGVHFQECVGHWTSTCSPARCGEPTGKLEPVWKSLGRVAGTKIFEASWRVRQWFTWS